MIRVRLAVFLAVAIVFAPGANLGGGSTPAQPSEVAARMLAPTFDVAQVAGFQSTAFAKKAQNQERRHFIGLLALATLAGAVCVPNFRSHGLFSEPIDGRLRPVISSRRERGPPHLQLV